MFRNQRDNRLYADSFVSKPTGGLITAMIEVNYGVFCIDGRWTIVSEGLRFGSYDSAAEAEQMARHIADQTAGLPVQLYLQNDAGEVRREQYAG